MSSIWRELDRINRNYQKQQYLNAVQNCYDVAIETNKNIEEYISVVENIHRNCELITFDVEEYYNAKMTPLILEEYVALEFPNEKAVRRKHHCLKENKFLEKIDKTRKEKRIQRGEEFIKEWNELSKKYWDDEKKNKEKYEKYKVDEINKNNEINKNIINAKQKYKENNEVEIKKVLREYLESVKLSMDKGLKSFDVEINVKNKCWQFNLEYSAPESLIPEFKKMTYVKSKNEFKKTPFSEREKNSIFQSYVFNTSLALVSIVSYAFLEKIDQIIINCYVYGIDYVTGKNERKCIFSSIFSTKDLNYFNLKYIDSKAFFDSVGSKYSFPLIALKKVIPYSNSEVDPLDYIDNEIDGFEFEKFSKKLLEKNGFENVLVTKASGDYGADIIAYKDKIKYAIQCKKFSSKVGVKAVQEVMASREIYKCHVGAILTNNYFTPSAIKLAEDNKIILWDKLELSKMIDSMNEKVSVSKSIIFNTNEYDMDDKDIVDFVENYQNSKDTVQKKDLDEKLNKEMNLYGLEEDEKELVRKGYYDPSNFEDHEDVELDEDDYYYEDK